MKIADSGVAPLRSERHELARDLPREHEAAPGVIVELGRSTADVAGTYNARGVLEGAAKSAAAVPGTSSPAEPHLPTLPSTTLPAGTPGALRVPANAQMQTLANASPQVAASLRPTVYIEMAYLQQSPLALTAGIQTLAASALKQAEKGNATAEHEDEADPLRKEKEQPRREGGKQRGR